jgi:glutamyl-tRNA reductase
LDQLKSIAFTHKNTPLKELNRFFLHEENRKERLEFLKYSCDINEILYIPTCNRIEFVFTSHHNLDQAFLKKFFCHFRQDWDFDEIDFAIRHAEVYEGEDALKHIFRVASSLDSLVVGEREIISQVRKSYETCKSEGLTGDLLRLVVKCAITTAKQVYTETKIAVNPVSVVSLAERELRNRKLNPEARILLIGSGETNTNLSKYLVKDKFTNFVIFNRTLENAKKLAKVLSTNTINAEAYPLEELKNYTKGFDALIVCTSSSEKIITPELYSRLLGNDKDEKIIIDLSIPSNIDPAIYSNNKIKLIDISNLQEVAGKNVMERQSEVIAAEEIIEENISHFRHMHRTRNIEVKMKDVPEKIREIRERAVNDIFAEDINNLDQHSKEVLGKVLDYMEKKCISVPMIIAKEIILETSQ